LISPRREIETAVREHIPLVVLLWEDGGHGLIECRMDLDVGAHNVGSTKADMVVYTRSSPPLRMPDQHRRHVDDVSIIGGPVDYYQDSQFIDRLR
jgi:acetolactate synthase-1/2/3 large subunit